MVRLINWKATPKEGVWHAECHQFPKCKAIKLDFDDLIQEVKTMSTEKMGSCKVLMTIYFNTDD